jgi:hypothetical protein
MTIPLAAVVDCETTADVPAPAGVLLPDGNWQREVFYPKPDLSVADPGSLRMNHFYERYTAVTDREQAPRFVAEAVARLLAGRWIVGSVPSFDANMLDPWLRRNGQAPAWHYRLGCVESFAAGKLGIEPPWETEDLYRGLGLIPENFERHTAEGDRDLAIAVYEAVFRRQP